MKHKKIIQFRKQRDFGDIISDTFSFVRYEFQPFFGTVLKIAGPYVFLFLASFAGYTFFFGSLNQFGATTFGIDQGLEDAEIFLFLGLLLVLFVCSIAANIMLTGSVMSYIRNYTENDGKVNFQEVKSYTYQKFWSLLGLGILYGMTVGLGLVFCILPGIYVLVVLALSGPILMMENKGAGDAYQDSFSLIKGEFWITLGIFFVMWIIVMIGSGALGLLQVMCSWLEMGIFSGEFDAETFDLYQDPVYIILELVNNLVQMLMNLILLVTACLVYFHLHEQKNSTGALERIGNLGNSTSE